MSTPLPRPYPPNFFKIIEDVLEKEEKDRKPSTELRHNPSSASFVKSDGTVTGACLRQVYYRAIKQPESDKKKFSSKLQAGFGNAIHTWLLDKIKKSDKLKIQPEASGTYHHDELENIISYRLDGLVTHNGDVGGLEIKTQMSYGLSRMLKEGGPKDSDLLQVLSYFGVNDLIRWFSLCYVARDTAFNAEFHLWKDPETDVVMIEGVYPRQNPRPVKELTFNGSVSRWKELESAVKLNQLPPRDYKAVLTKEGVVTDKRVKNGVEYNTDWQCGYCAYKTHCWSLPDALENSKKVGV